MSNYRHSFHGGGGRMDNASQHHIVPPAPPPPVLSQSRAPTRGNSRRSRSRSRDRKYSSRSIRATERRSRSRSRSKETKDRRRRGRSRSPLQLQSAGSSMGSSIPPPLPASGASTSNILPMMAYQIPMGLGALANRAHELAASQHQSISLIAGQGSLPIIRRILDPDLVKIPRRAGEGVRPIFEREELKDAMRRRFAAVDEDLPPTNVPSSAQPATQQRVIAIIREPATLPNDVHMSSASASKDKDDRGRNGPSRSSNRPRSQSPLKRNSRSRSRGRDRGREVRKPIERERERDRDIGGKAIINVRSQQERNRERTERERDRSPVRILRERPSRSRSNTPPPMPLEIRRKLERERDLRSRLSRPIGRIAPKPDHSDMLAGSGTYGERGAESTFFRGRGGFRGREVHRGPWKHDMFERESTDGQVNAANGHN